MKFSNVPFDSERLSDNVGLNKILCNVKLRLS